MDSQLYPLLFEPIFRQSNRRAQGFAPWIAELMSNCNLAPPAENDIDECWLLADSKDIQSTVANGRLAGVTLRSLVAERPLEMVGRHHASRSAFPLMARVFATAEEQPLLVHPDSDAGSERWEKHGNMKIWYSLAVQGDARAYVGIDPRVSAQQLFANINSPQARQFLQKLKIRPGDSCLIPPGMVHSLSTGHLIWELKPRPAPPLCLGPGREQDRIPAKEQEMARDSVKLESRQSTRTARVRSPLTHTRKISLTRHWPYFSVEELRIADHISLETAGVACHLLYPTVGRCLIRYRQGQEFVLPLGRICCVPAILGKYQLVAEAPSEILRATHQVIG